MPASTRLLLTTAAAAAGLAAVPTSAAEPRPIMKSPVKKDESVTLFTTAAWPSLREPGNWEVEIRGVIFEDEARPLVAAALTRMLRIDPEALTDEEKTILAARVALFLVDNERGKAIPVTAGEHGAVTRLMPESEPNGHFGETVTLSGSIVDSVKSHGGIPLQVVLPPGDTRGFTGTVRLMPDGPQPLVISDIDDTIKITSVRDREEAKRNTFCRPFRAVEGMAAVYQAWERAGAGFCYVSGSPWQLYRPLEDFRKASAFPDGAWHLKHIRLMDPSTLAALLGSQLEYKLAAIEPLLARWPQRPVVLAGDSGEQDPEVYGTLARRHPDRVVRIFIRNVTEELRTAARFEMAFAGVAAEKWQLFEKADELPRRLPPGSE